MRSRTTQRTVALLAVGLALAAMTGCRTRRSVEKASRTDSMTAVAVKADSTARTDSALSESLRSTRDCTAVYAAHSSERNREVRDSMDIRLETVYDTVTRVLTNTIYRDRWHTDLQTLRVTDTLWRDRLVVDSTSAYAWYRSSMERMRQTCDSIERLSRCSTLREKTVEVNRLRWWQKVLMGIGLTSLLAAAGYAAYRLYAGKGAIARVIRYIKL